MQLQLCRQCFWFEIILLLGAVTATVVTNNTVRYDEHKLYAICMGAGDSRIKREINRHIILDHSQSQGNLNVTILVEQHEASTFQSILKDNNIWHEELNVNFQRMIDDESKNIKPLSVSITEFDWKNFYHLETIHKWLDNLAEKYSDIITPLNIGTSYEGRPLKGVKLSHRNDNPSVFIEGGIHAREWIGPSVATFILNQLLTSTDTNVQRIARNFDWIVFPVCNPDGYKYTFNGDRLWRKNRESFGSCVGVDLNRNWDSSWNDGIGEGSTEPCGDKYPGPYAFSAPETKFLSTFLRDNVQSQRIQTYLSFHSAAQKLLFPYAGKRAHLTNIDDFERIGALATKALAKSNGTKFETGNAFGMMYEAPGTSIDWVYDELNIPIVFAFELRRSKRDTDFFSARFLLPADQIEPAGCETLDSVIALLNEAEELGYYQRKSSSYHYSVAPVIFYSIGLSALLVVIIIVGLYYARKYGFSMTRRHTDDRHRLVYQALIYDA